MSLMNGVDSEEIIAEQIGKSHILPAVIKVASHREADGYHFDPETTLGIIFGEYEAPYESERVKAVKELFAGTGIHYRSTEYAIEEVWCKFRLNVCNNLPQAILGAGVGCYRDSEHMKAIQNGLKKNWKQLQKRKELTSVKRTECPDGEVRFRQWPVIPHYRIWMQDVIRRSICSPER